MTVVVNCLRPLKVSHSMIGNQVLEVLANLLGSDVCIRCQNGLKPILDAVLGNARAMTRHVGHEPSQLRKNNHELRLLESCSVIP